MADIQSEIRALLKDAPPLVADKVLLFVAAHARAQWQDGWDTCARAVKEAIHQTIRR